MTAQEFKNNLKALVERYIASEGSFDDNPQIEINLDTLSMSLIDGDEIGDEDANDYYAVYDLICFAPGDSGKGGRTLVFDEAIDEVTSNYFETL